MADMMLFPETWEEFEKQYMMIDKEQIYSNGIEYIPCFRVRQWMEHIENKKKHEANKMAQVAAMFGKKLGEEFLVELKDEYSIRRLGKRIWKMKLESDGLRYYIPNECWVFNRPILSDLLTGEAVIVDEKTDDFTE